MVARLVQKSAAGLNSSAACGLARLLPLAAQRLRGYFMADKWAGDELTPGSVLETTFWPNPVKDSGFRFRATHLDGKRAPKVVLCDDPRIRPGISCLVKIAAIRKPQRNDRGAIEVEFVQAQPFKIEGVYLDPLVSRKLQILLESGLNILIFGR